MKKSEEQKIVEGILNPKEEKQDSVADTLEKIADDRIRKEQENIRNKMPRHGDIMGGTVLKGHKLIKCPKCKLYLPAMFLRFDDKLGHQTIGYACSKCDSPLIAITRSKKDGKIMRRYVANGVKMT
jgi:hypothetical protein